MKIKEQLQRRSEWTDNERELDEIMSLMESRNQMDRITGRFRYREFAERFTHEELSAMAKTIGARETK